VPGHRGTLRQAQGIIPFRPGSRLFLREGSVPPTNTAEGIVRLIIISYIVLTGYGLTAPGHGKGVVFGSR